MGTVEAPSDWASEAAMTGIEKLAFGLFLVGTIVFFAWVAVLALRK
jgi:hypothetical protein